VPVSADAVADALAIAVATDAEEVAVAPESGPA
jgi:hypothetical protein